VQRAFRGPWFVVAGLALVTAGLLAAAPEEVSVGAIRAALAREGTVLRERASPVGKPVGSVAHGTQLRVEAREGAWIRVTTLPAAGQAAVTGWVRASQTVEPFALTQGGQRGAVAARAGVPSQSELSAAGRQFDAATEDGYRRANPNLAPYFPMVDRIEGTKPTAEEVDRFVLEGRLGRPGRDR